MIVDFTVNLNDYIEKLLNNYLFFDYIFPKCGAKHSFSRHGSYERNTCFMDKDNKIESRKKFTIATLIGHAIIPSHTKNQYSIRESGSLTLLTEDVQFLTTIWLMLI